MTPLAFNLRLCQLEENISRVLQLLNEYEIELSDEDDPSRKSKYRRRIQSLKQQHSEYSEELTNLRVQYAIEDSLQLQNISKKLQNIDIKIDQLLDTQASLNQVLALHFSAEEQKLMLPFVDRLSESDLMSIQAFLEIVETDQASGEEVQQMLTRSRLLLEKLQECFPPLSTEQELIAEIINSPEIDAKHALKVSIPIIPFLLTYEGELSLGTGVNLREIWQSWKIKFLKS